MSKVILISNHEIRFSFSVAVANTKYKMQHDNNKTNLIIKKYAGSAVDFSELIT